MRRAVACLFVLGVGACALDLQSPNGRACDSTHACMSGESCRAGVCVSDAMASDAGDSGAPPEDSGVTDAGGDGGVDGGLDGGDGGTDAGGLDAGDDAGTDAGLDAGPSLDAGVFYVDPLGNDLADGLSPATPWKNVARVNAYPAQPGAVFLFRGGGVWNAELHPLNSGTVSAPITFGSYGTGRPVLEGSAATKYSGIVAVNLSHLRFQNFELRNFPRTQGVYLQGTTNVRLDNLWIHDVLEGIHATTGVSPAANNVVQTAVIERVGMFLDGGVLEDGGVPFVRGISLNDNGTGWKVSDVLVLDVAQTCISDLNKQTSFTRVMAVHCGANTPNTDRYGVDLSGSDTVANTLDVSGTPNTACILSRANNFTLDSATLSACSNGVFVTASAQGLYTLRRLKVLDVGSSVFSQFPLGAAPSFRISNSTFLLNRADGGFGGGPSMRGPAAWAFENNLVVGGANIPGGSSGATSVLSVQPPDGGWDAGLFVDRKNVYPPGNLYLGTTALSAGQYWAQSGSGTTSFFGVQADLRSIDVAAADFRLNPDSGLRDWGVTDPATGVMVPGCDGGYGNYCGSAPEPGAFELP